ncbi:MAG: 2-oxoacid:ferredoxin oxidoreductase subunit beta, partial [Wenzhouxiangella sp.]
GYKKRVRPGFEPTEDRAQAYAALAEDDGFTLGTLYRAKRPCYRPDRAGRESTVDRIAARFEVAT